MNSIVGIGFSYTFSDNTHRIHVWYINLHLVDFYGKCREIEHTWILWDIAQEDLTDKRWLIGTFGLGYMATIPFKNNRPALDDCTLIENTRTHFRIIRNTWFHIFALNYLHVIAFFSPLSLSLSCFFCFTSSRSTLHLHAAINPSTFQSLY